MSCFKGLTLWEPPGIALVLIYLFSGLCMILFPLQLYLFLLLLLLKITDWWSMICFCSGCAPWITLNEKYGCTWVVSAASCRAASHPASLVHRHRPLVDLVILQGVRGEVADLDLCVVLLEILKWHPTKAQVWSEGRLLPPKSLVTVSDRENHPVIVDILMSPKIHQYSYLSFSHCFSC